MYREFGIPPRDVFEDRRRCALEDWSAFPIALYDYKLRDPNECSSLKNDIVMTYYYSNILTFKLLTILIYRSHITIINPIRGNLCKFL